MDGSTGGRLSPRDSFVSTAHIVDDHGGATSSDDEYSNAAATSSHSVPAFAQVGSVGSVRRTGPRSSIRMMPLGGASNDASNNEHKHRGDRDSVGEGGSTTHHHAHMTSALRREDVPNNHSNNTAPSLWQRSHSVGMSMTQQPRPLPSHHSYSAGLGVSATNNKMGGVMSPIKVAQRAGVGTGGALDTHVRQHGHDSIGGDNSGSMAHPPRRAHTVRLQRLESDSKSQYQQDSGQVAPPVHNSGITARSNRRLVATMSVGRGEDVWERGHEHHPVGSRSYNHLGTLTEAPHGGQHHVMDVTEAGADDSSSSARVSEDGGDVHGRGAGGSDADGSSDDASGGGVAHRMPHRPRPPVMGGGPQFGRRAVNLRGGRRLAPATSKRMGRVSPILAPRRPSNAADTASTCTDDDESVDASSAPRRGGGFSSTWGGEAASSGNGRRLMPLPPRHDAASVGDRSPRNLGVRDGADSTTSFRSSTSSLFSLATDVHGVPIGVPNIEGSTGPGRPTRVAPMGSRWRGRDFHHAAVMPSRPQGRPSGPGGVAPPRRHRLSQSSLASSGSGVGGLQPLLEAPSANHSSKSGGRDGLPELGSGDDMLGELVGRVTRGQRLVPVSRGTKGDATVRPATSTVTSTLSGSVKGAVPTPPRTPPPGGVRHLGVVPGVHRHTPHPTFGGSGIAGRLLPAMPRAPVDALESAIDSSHRQQPPFWLNSRTRRAPRSPLAAMGAQPRSPLVPRSPLTPRSLRGDGTPASLARGRPLALGPLSGVGGMAGVVSAGGAPPTHARMPITPPQQTGPIPRSPITMSRHTQFQSPNRRLHPPIGRSGSQEDEGQGGGEGMLGLPRGAGRGRRYRQHAQVLRVLHENPADNADSLFMIN